MAADQAPDIPPEAPIPTWKHIGIYTSESGKQAYVIGAAGAAGFEVLQDGVAVPDVQVVDVQMLQIQGVNYTRVNYTDEILGEFIPAKAKASARGQSGRTVFIGSSVVFKNSFDASFTQDAVVQEASRNLYGLSIGIPHARCFGIHQDEDGKFYFLEELVDVERTDNMYIAASQFILNVPNMYTLFPAAFDFAQDSAKADYVELISLPFSTFLTQFTELRDMLKRKNVGGDFKLDNLIFSKNTTQLVFSDLFFPSPENPFRPKSWEAWLVDAKTEDPTLHIFVNPFKRLAYWATTKAANDVAQSLAKEFPGKPFASVAKWKVSAAPSGGRRATRRVKKERRSTLRR